MNLIYRLNLQLAMNFKVYYTENLSFLLDDFNDQKLRGTNLTSFKF